MSTSNDREAVRFYRPALLSGVELVSVSYRERSFPVHSHREYVIGAVVAGAETLTVGGRAHHVDAGRVLLLHPDEVHANATIGPDPLRYHVLYIDKAVARRFGDEHHLGFSAPVSDDPTLLAAVNAAHSTLASNVADLLEQENALSELVEVLGAVSSLTADRSQAPNEPPANVIAAKAYIDQNYADGFGLQDLASLTGLSTFHFSRSFKKAIGLSPLAYRNQRRVTEARLRLLDGQSIAQVALDMGYADQSHLTRQFQRIVGASPRRYAQQ